MRQNELFIYAIFLFSLATIVSSVDVYSQDSEESNQSSIFSDLENFESDLLSFYSNIPDLNGTYINDEIGFQINLPLNWTGKQMSFLTDMVMVSPNGIDLESIETPEIMMTINTINEEYFNMFSDTLQSENVSNETTMTDTGTFDPESCKLLSSSPVLINTIKSEEVAYECIIDGMVTQSKGYAFATTDNSLIVVGLIGNNNTFNEYLPSFEDSIKTIQISNPVDVATSEIYKKYKEFEMQ